jgi:putative exporter of polyketide antibiotics
MLLLREPPANGNFMLAAYTIVAIVLVGYSVMLMLRVAAEEKREEGTGNREQ